MIDKRTSTLGVVLCFLLTAIFGYFVGKYVKPNTIVSHIDTVSVVTKIDSARNINVLDLMNAKYLILTKESIKTIESTFAK